MTTYKTNNNHKIPSVIRELRSEGFRAWAETVNGVEVLCTDASVLMLGLCAGGTWAEKLYDGLPS